MESGRGRIIQSQRGGGRQHNIEPMNDRSHVILSQFNEELFQRSFSQRLISQSSKAQSSILFVQHYFFLLSTLSHLLLSLHFPPSLSIHLSCVNASDVGNSLACIIYVYMLIVSFVPIPSFEQNNDRSSYLELLCSQQFKHSLFLIVSLLFFLFLAKLC